MAYLFIHPFIRLIIHFFISSSNTYLCMPMGCQAQVSVLVPSVSQNVRLRAQPSDGQVSPGFLIPNAGSECPTEKLQGSVHINPPLLLTPIASLRVSQNYSQVE